ncbi:hypothetical protein EYC08_14080 [Tabrizicola sp. WMC-M-20]|nr:hypothetical protein EYC08_14080 [Tabrizicola sp. WMC-M-20]
MIQINPLAKADAPPPANQHQTAPAAQTDLLPTDWAPAPMQRFGGGCRIFCLLPFCSKRFEKCKYMIIMYFNFVRSGGDCGNCEGSLRDTAPGEDQWQTAGA